MKNITAHANERFFERTNQEISRKAILNHLNNGNEILYAKRLTTTRSLAYVSIQKEIFKIIINRKRKILISILPFNDVFIRKIQFFSEHYNNKNYLVKLYPDCYRETKSMYTLTEIYETNDNELTKLNYNHPFFDGLFKSAWSIHLNLKRINRNDKISIEAETETIKATISINNE